MSRIGRQTIQIPEKVDVSTEDEVITVEGPKGSLERELHRAIIVNIEDDEINVDIENKENKQEKSLWGTFTSRIQNMIEGVTSGFKKELEINGVGYRASMKGADLKIEAGYSDPVIYEVPDDIDVSVEGNEITVKGIDKELVGKVAAEIRSIRKPEPYKGKGIKYVDETIRRKEGKTATGEMSA